MRTLFPGFYKPSDEEYKHIWENAIIVPDTNVLLDFYRVSNETRDDLLNVFHSLKERLWIPYQVAYEYHTDLLSVIEKQMTNYDNTLKRINDFEKDLSSKRNHPFIPYDMHQKASDVFESLSSYVEEQKEWLHSNLTHNNSLKDDVANIFEGKVGECHDDAFLDEVRKSGAERYKNKIPPGYEDQKSKKGDEMYGDYIIWLKIIEKSKESSKPIMFITNDVKKDWFWIDKQNKTLGPRVELIKEFKENTGQLICFYQLFQFLSYANEYKKINIKDASVEELRESSEQLNSTDDICGNNNSIEESVTMLESVSPNESIVVTDIKNQKKDFRDFVESIAKVTPVEAVKNVLEENDIVEQIKVEETKDGNIS